jgi:hypothetical protein
LNVGLVVSVPEAVLVYAQYGLLAGAVSLSCHIVCVILPLFVASIFKYANKTILVGKLINVGTVPLNVKR